MWPNSKELLRVHSQTIRESDRSQAIDKHWLSMSLGVLLAVLVLISGLLWMTGMFDLSKTDDTLKVLTALIALIGSLFGTAVTLIGLMLKRSLDAKNMILKNEAEERLKLDTAIKAVELFKTASNSASPAESAGALFALSRLGQSEFALRLLEELWPRNIIQTPSAMWIINNAIQSNEPRVPGLAISILRGNTHKLFNGEGGRWWPLDYVVEWPDEIGFSYRFGLLCARINSLVSVEFKSWNTFSLVNDTLALAKCFRKDTDPYIKRTAAAFLIKLIQIYDLDPEKKCEIRIERELLDLHILKAEIDKEYGSSFSTELEQALELEGKLGEWLKDKKL